MRHNDQECDMKKLFNLSMVMVFSLLLSTNTVFAAIMGMGMIIIGKRLP